MQRFSQSEYDNLIAGIKREPFDRSFFDKAAKKISRGFGVRPSSVMEFDGRFPVTLADWRQDQQWSLALVERHDDAAEAAWHAYWNVMSAATAKDSTPE